MGTPLRALIVEDSPDDELLLLRELRRTGYDVTHRRVETAAAMREALAERPWEVVLSDFSMPEFSAPQALSILQEVSPETPMIIVSGTIGEDAAVEAIRSGARDYLLKGSLKRLVPAVQRELEAARSRRERRATEAALETASDQLRAAQRRILQFFTLSLELLCVIGFDQRFHELNPAWARALGFPLDELRRRPLLDLVHPADREAVRAEWQRLLAGDTVSFEGRFQAQDGSYVWLLWKATASLDDRLCYAAARDVTALRQARDDLVAHAARQHALAELGRLALVSAELEPVVSEAAAVVARTLGTKYACVLELDAGADALRVLAIVGAGEVGGSLPRDAAHQLGFALQGEAPVVAEDLATEARFGPPPLFPDQDVRSGVCVALPGAQGRLGALGAFATAPRRFSAEETQFVQSVAHVVATVLQRRQAEEALRAMEAQFRQAQKMEAIGRLAGGVAHDFNNLLTAILGYSDLALSLLRPDDPLRRHVEQIHKAGTRATALTRQLLVFSRHQALERKVLDLNAIVADMRQMLGRLLGEDIEIRLSLSPDLGRVQADAGQVEQVILNLSVNARDAMAHGGRLTIETANAELGGDPNGFRARVKPGAYVMLAVSDTGTGIPPEVMAHLFEPFFTTKPAGKGTGLGLSTVYGIAQGAGGVVSVYTEVGRGTTFKVYLPRVDAAPDRLAPSEELPLGRGSETILLVEDDDLVRELARQVLRSSGYEVIAAPNGGAALLACDKQPGPIHLLLTDVVMPEMSGKELALRLAPLRPGLKVLYASGYTSGVVLHDEVLGSGAAFIQKPFAPRTLLRKVREVLDGPGAPAS